MNDNDRDNDPMLHILGFIMATTCIISLLTIMPLEEVVTFCMVCLFGWFWISLFNER